MQLWTDLYRSIGAGVPLTHLCLEFTAHMRMVGGVHLSNWMHLNVVFYAFIHYAECWDELRVQSQVQPSCWGGAWCFQNCTGRRHSSGGRAAFLSLAEYDPPCCFVLFFRLFLIFCFCFSGTSVISDYKGAFLNPILAFPFSFLSEKNHHLLLSLLELCSPLSSWQQHSILPPENHWNKSPGSWWIFCNDWKSCCSSLEMVSLPAAKGTSRFTSIQ